MAKMPAKTFRLKLELAESERRFVIARIPADLDKAWPGWKNRRIHGTINGFDFSNALMKARGGKGYILLVYKRLLDGARARVGETVTVTLEPDLTERTAQEIPRELAGILKGERTLRRWFEALPPSYIRGISFYVDQAKGAETRMKRAEQMAERMMLTMEGEVELPPILRAAFERQPMARQGWKAMTPTQRRNHLFGIFYYQSMPGREKRLAQLVEEALAVARRKGGKAGEDEELLF
jgi:uncharacterized protein YdeI (YjbR/CyaY-like superfamily)